jgi:macrolide transport system ATP-binding/permease protein
MALLIKLRGIRKSYGGVEGEPSVEILHGIDLTIHAGEFVALNRWMISA